MLNCANFRCFKCQRSEFLNNLWIIRNGFYFFILFIGFLVMIRLGVVNVKKFEFLIFFGYVCNGLCLFIFIF